MSGILKIILTVLLILTLQIGIRAQFPPPAGQPGTTAIHADSSVFTAWATSCTIERGYTDISNTALGLASFGDEQSPLGKADNNVISLGDNGISTLGFEVPIANGEGWDFAVFENSFSDDFLELAFVEVSSNGIDYHRFSNTSLTGIDSQIEAFGTIDATRVDGLAGKYRIYYGVPFDLEELSNIPDLDIDNIINVRIIDVVGSIDPGFSMYDSHGNIINDPWPTPFESSGFDLDAVGVINNRDNTGTEQVVFSKGVIYPNPSRSTISISNINDIDLLLITSIQGETVKSLKDKKTRGIDISELTPGYYIINIYSNNQIITDKLIIY